MGQQRVRKGNKNSFATLLYAKHKRNTMSHLANLLFAASRGIGAPPTEPKSLSQKTATNAAKHRRTNLGFSSFHLSITTTGMAFPKISKRRNLLVEPDKELF